MNVREVVVKENFDYKYKRTIEDLGFITISYEDNHFFDYLFFYVI